MSISSSSHPPTVVVAIALSDAPKASSKQAIKALEAMGVEVNMMTGDAKGTALAIAKQVGIREDRVWANMSPKGKAAVVTELMQKDGGGVAMVRSSVPPIIPHTYLTSHSAGW